MKKILFVCTGNTCRSPMAHAIFDSLTKDIPFVCADSAGIYGDGVSGISSNASAVLKSNGIDFTHTSTPLTEHAVKDACLVFGMTESHARHIAAMFPQYADKIFPFTVDVADPYGGDIETYTECFKQIKEGIGRIITLAENYCDE